MSSNDLSPIIRQLSQSLTSPPDRQKTKDLLAKAKLHLFRANALVAPSSPELTASAIQVFELGALISIRLQDPAEFTRYFQILQTYYDQPTGNSQGQSQRSKITGLYLLLLLSQGDYAGFHTLLEGLDVAARQHGKALDDDEFVQYPMRLEQWLMEGSYDRVWEETKSERVPSEEFAIFSDILIGTIRSEVASCSEKAYPSIPVRNAKSLLFLDSEGGVVGYSQQRGWQAKDGRIYFPTLDSGANENDVLTASGEVIEHTLGYARELETIV